MDNGLIFPYRRKTAHTESGDAQCPKLRHSLRGALAWSSARSQRLKGTPGITGFSCPRFHIDRMVWHLDVGSSHPGAGVGPKGWAVRPLKRYASWVQNVVRQFGLYPSRA